MKAPDIPEDEEIRLATLLSLNILDSMPEDRFDRLTRMAKRLFGVPIALVSLVDENRQWFKSSIGLDAEETPRDISFCGHAILGDDIFVVADAERDPRFADNPLVTDDPRIRFYAGCPLKALNGTKVGTLCVIDQQPREFDPEDYESLRDLAAMVESELAAIQLANVDELTSIPNRRGFLTLAKYGLNLCIRQKQPACLLYFDMNNFKSINDQFGHAEGDKVLIVFAKLMNDVFRDSDLFARFGGDEFVVLVANVTRESSKILTGRLHKSIEDYNKANNLGYTMSVSVGVVEFDPATHTSIEALLAEADSRMYQNKSEQV